MMAEPAFSVAIERALDSYVVPPIPAGFSDRLMARIASGESVAVAAQPRQGWSRRASPWRRTSRILGSLALLSVGAVAAAAAGVFGEPVYMPGISEALIKAHIVAAPEPVPPTKPRYYVQQRLDAGEGSAAAMPPLTGSAAIVDRVTRLRTNSEFTKLAPRQRMAATVKEVRQMVRTGEVTRHDARTAVRALAQSADPQTRAEWRKMVAMRREKRLADLSANRAKPVTEAVLAPHMTTVPSSQPDLPAAAKDMVTGGDIDLSSIDAPKLTPERTTALRERFRDASPEQRAAMKAALRERRQTRQQRRSQ